MPPSRIVRRIDELFPEICYDPDVARASVIDDGERVTITLDADDARSRVEFAFRGVCAMRSQSLGVFEEVDAFLVRARPPRHLLEVHARDSLKSLLAGATAHAEGTTIDLGECRSYALVAADRVIEIVAEGVEARRLPARLVRGEWIAASL